MLHLVRQRNEARGRPWHPSRMRWQSLKDSITLASSDDLHHNACSAFDSDSTASESLNSVLAKERQLSYKIWGLQSSDNAARAGLEKLTVDSTRLCLRLPGLDWVRPVTFGLLGLPSELCHLSLCSIMSGLGQNFLHIPSPLCP